MHMYKNAKCSLNVDAPQSSGRESSEEIIHNEAKHNWCCKKVNVIADSMQSGQACTAHESVTCLH